MKAMIKAKISGLMSSESGAVATVAALLMTVLLAFTAFAIDIGNLALVKSEMQRAADAGALAGARAYVPYNTSAGLVGTVQWTNGAAVAGTTVEANKAAGKELTDHPIETGYWNLDNKVLQSTGITPTSKDLPAVRVTLTKASGQNDGAVNFYFGSFVGQQSADLTVQSMAALPGGPVSAGPGACFPLAAPETWVKNNWNNTNDFKMYSDYHDDNGGQFTPFTSEENNVPAIRALVDNGNSGSLNIGDNIYIQPGTKASLYGYIADNCVGKTVLIPVVKDDFQTHNFTPIKGFVAFKITAANQGQKWVQGHFEKNYVAPGTKGGPDAPFYGTYASTPKLIK